MSFSTEQKKEIINTVLRSHCCRRALLDGILASHSDVRDGAVFISLDSSETVDFVSPLITETYGKHPIEVKSAKGGRRKLISFESKAAEKYIDSQAREISFTSRCPACQAAFLRGVFLASGRVSDPEKQYSLEFSLGRNTDAFYEFFICLGITPRISEKPSERIIYFKNSTEIEDFFAMAGMNATAFIFMNKKIQGEIRNNANRVANCEINNIGKAVSASVSQIAEIKELISRGLLSQLPDELIDTALARMQHEDLSLARLASIMTPPISKQGLSHRLKKISEIAGELLRDKK